MAFKFYQKNKNFSSHNQVLACKNTWNCRKTIKINLKLLNITMVVQAETGTQRTYVFSSDHPMRKEWQIRDPVLACSTLPRGPLPNIHFSTDAFFVLSKNYCSKKRQSKGECLVVAYI